MRLGRKRKSDDEDEDYSMPKPPWRLTRQARETITFCLVASLIAALVWGVYTWTHASRYTPPIYSGGTTLHE